MSPTDPPHPLLDSSQLLSLRRGSLPVMLPTPGYPMNEPQPVNQAALYRRRSIDTSLHRLASHPYAHLAVAKNNAIYGPSISRSSSQLRVPAQPQNQHTPTVSRTTSYSNPSQHHPNMGHRASLPHALGPNGRSLRYTNPASSSSPSPSPLSFPSTRNCSQDAHFFTLPARAIASPIPGPLPAPDFSFGAPVPPPSSTPPTNEGDLSEGQNFPRPPYGFVESDVDDGASSASYLSRFSSIASAAGSETSNNSSLFSDVQPGFQAEARRPSW